MMVSPPRATRISQNSSEASLNASRLRPCWSMSVNTGTKAADRAACEKRLLTRFGICEATVKAEPAADVAKKLAWTTSRPRPATRDTAVAAAKMAVFRASRRRPGDAGGTSLGGAGGEGGPGGVFDPVSELGTVTSAL